MTYISKLILSGVFFLLLGITSGSAQTPEKTQSIIYDATTIMNAKHGLDALLIPRQVGWDIENPLTHRRDATSVDTTDAKYFNSDSSEAVIVEVLRRNADLPVGASKEQVIDAYKSNPFLKDLLSAARFAPTMLPASIQLGKPGNYRTSTGSGGLGHDLLGNLVNGTADFLIKRAQEEISISVFEKLKQFIERYPELDTLFPQTCALIKPVEAYEYNKALDAFKAAITADLENFVSKVPALYNIPRYAQLNKRVPALTLLFASCSVFTDLHGEQGLAATMYDLRQQAYLGEDNNYSGFIKVLSEISNSLLDKTLSDPKDKPRDYIQIEFISKVTHGDIVLQGELGKFYLGLLWQHIQSFRINVKGNSRTFASLLEANNTSAKLQKAIGLVSATLKTAHQVDSLLGVLKKEEITNAAISGHLEMKARRFVIYANIVSNLLDFSALFTDPANSDYAVRVHEIALYLPEFTTGVTNVIKDFYSKEYSLGISEFAKLLQTVSDYLEKTENDKALRDPLVNDLHAALTAQRDGLSAQISTLDLRIKTLSTTTASGQAEIDIQAEMQELTSSRQKLQASLDAVDYQLKNKGTVLFKLSKIIEYIQLFAAVTKAENSQAVEDLLETYALPAGSSRIKKVSSFNIAVNAYVGGFGGRKKDMGEGFTNTYGLTAPIGFSFSNGWGKGGSISLFLGAFDIGGVIRYKLNNQGQYEQNVTLAGIVSPSVHVAYGFPFYLPVSLGLGCQWISPNVSGTDKIDLKPTFNAFVAIDIPFFNLLVVKKK